MQIRSQIRSDLDLPTLRILIDPQRTSFTEAVFQVVRGRGTPSEVARCSLRDLGLPNMLTGSRPIDDDLLAIPEYVVTGVQRGVSGLGPSPLPPENALWLEFPSPRGFLYIAPWERLLEPLGRSLFRLPYHLVRPQATGQTLEVAICASAPKAKSAFMPPQILESLAAQYLNMTGRDVTVHIFTDESWFMQVRDLFNDAGLRIVVHDPADAADYERPRHAARASTSAQLSSPWLLWMRDAMGTKPLDFVHFVAHGYLSGDQGAIAVATSPTVNTDQAWSRFIGSVEVNTFLSQVGAWGLALTGPPRNYCEAGLRELGDAIALIRPGVTVTHNVERDPECRQLGLVLQKNLAPGTPLDHPLPAITCWVHPRFIDFPDEYRADLHLNVDGSSAFVAGATKEALAHSGTETWVASASRILEAQQMRWLPDSTDVSTDPAAVTALRNVADLVQRHVSQADLTRTIERCEQALAATPPYHPDQAMHLSNLAAALLTRFERIGSAVDLDQAVELYSQALAATAADNPDLRSRLSNLGNALRARFERTGNTADLDHAIELYQQAIAATPPDHPDWPMLVSSLGVAMQTRYWLTGSTADLERAIDLGQLAIAATPRLALTTSHSNLGNALRARFERTGSTADLDRAIELYQHAIAATPPDHPNWPMLVSSLGAALQTRFEGTGSGADLDRAIELYEQAIAATPPDHPNWPMLVSSLGAALQTRFEGTGSGADLDRAIELGQLAIAATPRLAAATALSNLGNALRARFERTGNTADLDHAIELYQQAIAATPPDHPNWPMLASSLGAALQTRFEGTGSGADLDRAIELYEQAIAATPPDHPDWPILVSSLRAALQTCSERDSTMVDPAPGSNGAEM